MEAFEMRSAMIYKVAIEDGEIMKMTTGISRPLACS